MKREGLNKNRIDASPKIFEIPSAEDLLCWILREVDDAQERWFQSRMKREGERRSIVRTEELG